ncbi:hypothetical protein GGI23_004246, partial [Coemansia sp. RSA 2559]
MATVAVLGLYALFHTNYERATSLLGTRTPAPYERTISYRPKGPKPVNACFAILARNHDWRSLRDSMKQMEDRFNHRYNYPYVFLNDKPFSEEFINMTRSMTDAEVFYGQIPKEHWSYPEWINQTKAMESRERMDKDGVMYGGSESYRHMCRFESGLFFKHPLMQQFDYYWRLEPGIQYHCDIT